MPLIARGIWSTYWGLIIALIVSSRMRVKNVCCYLYVCMYACMYVCMYVCMCTSHKHTHTHTFIYTYIHVYMSTYMHMCMYAYMSAYMHMYIYTRKFSKVSLIVIWHNRSRGKFENFENFCLQFGAAEILEDFAPVWWVVETAKVRLSEILKSQRYDQFM
jgi:hypothetical protein